MARGTKNHGAAGARRSAGFPPVRALINALAGPQVLDSIRRSELGVEALCVLASDALRLRENGSDQVAAEFMERFFGISDAAAGREPPAQLHGRMSPARVSKLLWLCLSRILELTQRLTQSRSAARWQSVHDMVDAWIHSWGNDERAAYARARFSTLTGLVKGNEPQAEYMHAALLDALSVIQA